MAFKIGQRVRVVDINEYDFVGQYGVVREVDHISSIDPNNTIYLIEFEGSKFNKFMFEHKIRAVDVNGETLPLNPSNAVNNTLPNIASEKDFFGVLVVREGIYEVEHLLTSSKEAHDTAIEWATVNSEDAYVFKILAVAEPQDAKVRPV